VQPTESTGPGRDRDVERFLTFVDAVVAIAITLLVLPLVDVAGEAADGRPVTQLLEDHQAQVWAFLLSFAVIANLWLTQHHVVRSVVASDPVVTRLTLFWLLTTVFLPFPTALVAEAGDQAVTKLLYIGTMTLSSLAVALMSRRIGAVRAIRDSDDAPDEAGAWVVTGLFAVALALGVAVPATGYFPLLLLLLPGVVARLPRRFRPGRRTDARVGH
jgi:uncharacterized membrane protein